MCRLFIFLAFTGFATFHLHRAAGKGLAGAVAVQCQAPGTPATVPSAGLSPSALPRASPCVSAPQRPGARPRYFNAIADVLLAQERGTVAFPPSALSLRAVFSCERKTRFFSCERKNGSKFSPPKGGESCCRCTAAPCPCQCREGGRNMPGRATEPRGEL